jgi:hypothetical protein
MYLLSSTTLHNYRKLAWHVNYEQFPDYSVIVLTRPTAPGSPFILSRFNSKCLYLCRYFGGLSLALLSDSLHSRGYLSLTTNRRLFASLSSVGPAAAMILLSFAACGDDPIAIVVLCVGFSLRNEPKRLITVRWSFF